MCLYDFPAHNDTNSTSTCDLEYACAPLKAAIEYGNLESSNETVYGYCQADDSAFYGTGINDCVSCLESSPSTYTANCKFPALLVRKSKTKTLTLRQVLLALEAGCQQEPAVGSLLSISGSLFSTAVINITVPSDNKSSSSSSNDHVLSLTAIIGIAVGLGVLFLLAAGLFILYYCQQRRYAREDAGCYRNNPYPSLQERYYCAQDMNSGHPPGQTYALPQYTMDYKPAVGTTNADGNDGFSNNAEYYDRLESISHKQPLGAHPVRLTNDIGVSSEVSDSVGKLNVSALPTHPAYIPRNVTPGQLGGRPSRNASRSTSMRSTTSSTEPLHSLKQQQRSQSRQDSRQGRSAEAPPSYALEVYLDAQDEPGSERASSRAEGPPTRNIQVELAGPPSSSPSQSPQEKQRTPSLGLAVPPPAVSWRSRRASVSPTRQSQQIPPPPPPVAVASPSPPSSVPNRAMTGTPSMAALILPPMPKLRMLGRKSSKPVGGTPSGSEQAGAGSHAGISGPLAFPDRRFSLRPLNNDRIVEQTVERVGKGHVVEVPIASGKSYLYG